MNSKLYSLLHRLSDGEFHSGEVLGEVAGVSRAAVWKQLQQLQELGVGVVSQRGRGYVIPGGLSLLEARKISAHLQPDVSSRLVGLDILPEVDSTNKFVLERTSMATGHGLVCVAERQKAGRGRRGRTWVSPFGANIYLSVGWSFSQGVAALEGLSLAVGVAVSRALEGLGFLGVQLKWPNDLLVEEKKLGGILLELTGDASGDCSVVTGIGLNVKMPSVMAAHIDQPWADLASLENVRAQSEPEYLDRNIIIAAILNELIPMLSAFEGSGFEPYRLEWERLNAHGGSRVNLHTPSQSIEGVVIGVTHAGGLRLMVDGEEKVFLGGELSLRAVSACDQVGEL
jgi:birA, biotin-[acetyl-CoA-carboxylase] ligase region